jgi:hypothetical protein
MQEKVPEKFSFSMAMSWVVRQGVHAHKEHDARAGLSLASKTAASTHLEKYRSSSAVHIVAEVHYIFFLCQSHEK